MTVNPKVGTRAARAIFVRDASLPLIRAHGEPFGPGLIAWRSGEWSAIYRTPFSRLNLCNPPVRNYREAVFAQQRRKVALPYGLDIFRARKVMNIEWDDSSIELINFTSGSWDDDLHSFLKNQRAEN